MPERENSEKNMKTFMPHSTSSSPPPRPTLSVSPSTLSLRHSTGDEWVHRRLWERGYGTTAGAQSAYSTCCPWNIAAKPRRRSSHRAKYGFPSTVYMHTARKTWFQCIKSGVWQGEESPAGFVGAVRGFWCVSILSFPDI